MSRHKSKRALYSAFDRFLVIVQENATVVDDSNIRNTINMGQK